MKTTWSFLFGLLLLSVTTTQAQFTYITNGDGSISLTKYTGSGGAVTVSNFVTGIATNAFYFSTNLTGVTIPDSVTSIGDGAFEECSSLTNASLGNFLTGLGNYTFEDCTNLASITLPDTLTNIGIQTFQGCTALTNVTTGSSVASIGDWAFYECFNLASFTIPSSVATIGNYAFQDCYGLTNVTIPSGVTTIGTNTFQGCTGLYSVTIPITVTSIEDWAFQGCTGLTNFTIPYSVASIGSGAFGWCGLINVTINDGVTNFGDDALQFCSSLASLSIPGSVASIGKYAFADCFSLTAINVNTNNPAFSSMAGVLFNQNQTTLIQYPLGNSASFYAIPNTVTSIGEAAFDHCTNLTSIAIPNSVTNIGTNAFNSCTGLTNLSIGNSLATIRDGAFNLCTNLASVVIPASVTSLGTNAFSYCGSLKAIYFQGNAPGTNTTVFVGDTMTAYYLAGTTGWAATYDGITAVKLNGITFNASPTTGVAPLTVNFTSASVDSVGNTINTWNWTFGDGSTGSGQNPSHTYATAGTFSPALLATNSSNAKVLGVSSATITVAPPLCIGGCSVSGANLVLNGANGVSGATYFVLMSTDMTLPLSQWTPVATNTVSTSGNFSITITNTVSHNAPQQFYILQSH